MYGHAVNLCEVYYDHIRHAGEASALQELQELEELGLVIYQDMDPNFWQEAGRIKATYRRVSLADCFLITLAQRYDAEIFTCDHHELETLAASAMCSIMFIR
jgi:predicted nucleic acid-binding protein